MRDLFDQIVAEGETAILRLIAEKRQEGVELDFKEKANASTGEPTKEDRRVLGIALSALSNSMGGLLIWGVQARKNEDQIDCATAPKPINQIDRFKGDVVRLISQAIMPRHEGIEVEAVPALSSSGAGYLLVLVKRSERRPHRCEFGEKQYFKRIGDSSLAMEHYDIEDSFKRMAVPELAIQYLVHEASVGGGGPHQPIKATIPIHVLLLNTSPITARFPYLALEDLRGATCNFNMQRQGTQRRQDRGVLYFESTADYVIHPDMLMIMAVLHAEAPVEPRENGGKRVHSLRPVSFEYKCGCLNSRQAREKIVIEPEELLKAIPGGFMY